MLKSLSKASVIAVASCAALFAQTANAEPTGYNQVSFSADASRKVTNDELSATLYKKAQSVNPKQLATELNKAINQAMQTAERYPSVTVTTGSQNTYPKYDDNSKITGWTGSVSVNVKSSDFDAASDLIAVLQENLVMQDLQFGVSDKKRDKVEQELMVEASKAFKAQAAAMVSAWDASGYQLLSVSINSQGNYYQPRMVHATTRSKSSIESQQFEGGDSTVTVTANGSIELIPWLK